jgi:hypothetical protein
VCPPRISEGGAGGGGAAHLVKRVPVKGAGGRGSILKKQPHVCGLCCSCQCSARGEGAENGKLGWTLDTIALSIHPSAERERESSAACSHGEVPCSMVCKCLPACF